MQRQPYKKVAYQRTIHRVEDATLKDVRWDKYQADEARYIAKLNAIINKRT